VPEVGEFRTNLTHFGTASPNFSFRNKFSGDDRVCVASHVHGVGPSRTTVRSSEQPNTSRCLTIGFSGGHTVELSSAADLVEIVMRVVVEHSVPCLATISGLHNLGLPLEGVFWGIEFTSVERVRILGSVLVVVIM